MFVIFQRELVRLQIVTLIRYIRILFNETASAAVVINPLTPNDL
jgi:hypothetical protein